MQRRRLVLTGVLLALARSAMGADKPRSYAVVSLIGNELSVVGYDASVGSYLDRNRRTAIPIPDATFDRSALIVASESLKQIDGNAQVALFAPKAPELFEQHERFFEGAKAMLPGSIGEELKKAGMTHLVLFTKHRADARLLLADSTNAGTGKLEGLGFFVDRMLLTHDANTGEQAQGTLAPYVYVKLSLVDLASASVLQAQPMTVSRIVAARQAQRVSEPWDALSAAEKVSVLREMLERETRRVMPALLARP